MRCLGRNNDDHCCYVAGKPCPFLRENLDPGFRWSCSLMSELGDWDKVIADPRYKPVGEYFSQFPYKNCRDFQCGQCKAVS